MSVPNFCCTGTIEILLSCHGHSTRLLIWTVVLLNSTSEHKTVFTKVRRTIHTSRLLQKLKSPSTQQNLKANNLTKTLIDGFPTHIKITKSSCTLCHWENKTLITTVTKLQHTWCSLSYICHPSKPNPYHNCNLITTCMMYLTFAILANEILSTNVTKLH